MEKYSVYEMTAQIPYKQRKDIGRGCALIDEEPKLIARFDTMEEAREELKKYTSKVEFVKHVVSYYQVTEYCIEIAEFDEDGEFVSGSDYDFVLFPVISFLELKHGDRIISPVDSEVNEIYVDTFGEMYLTCGPKSLFPIGQFDPNDFYLYDGYKNIGEIDEEFFK